jgi:CheY-like chemotaxis protein
MAKYKLVMLVDDNQIDNLINQEMIKSTDFAKEILVYLTGQEALEYLTEHQHQPEKLPEIIFLDINMPVMDGFQFLKDFEELDDPVQHTCKIIMLSSSISPKDIDRAASNRNVRKYLNKPLNERYLGAIAL